MTLKTPVQKRDKFFLVVTQDASYNAVNAIGFESMVHPIDEVSKDADTNKVLDFMHGADKMSAMDNHRKLVERWNNT